MPKRIVENESIPEVSTRAVTLEKFRGVDLSSSVTNVAATRSPAAPNMMPSTDGFPVKRPGWHAVLTLEGEVHGAYTLVKNGTAHRLVHAGTTLYKVTVGEDGAETAAAVYAEMADRESSGVQLNEKLWLLDGKTYLVYDGETVQPASAVATVPKITIAKAPNGKSGATSYLPVNLLTGKRTDSYRGTEETKAETVYYLSFNALTDTAVTAQVLQADGSWAAKAEGTDFTVDRPLGKVTFKTAPGKSPVDGEDNVQITYEVADRADTINKCRFCILYGVSGALDRVFAAGSPDEPNVDYWSEWSDPAYFGDVSYSILGQESSPIMGYSVLADTLVTHKQGEENGRNAFVRKGELDSDGFAVFKITNVIQGDGAVATRSFASLNSEPLFLTARGVYALTPSDVTGERYAQERSWYIGAALTREQALEKACATVWGRFYVLAVNGTLYLLDGAQKSYESKNPYSTYQYESYYWPGIPATCVWVEAGALRFGTAGGEVREFWPGTLAGQYNDGGQPVTAYWCTPLMNLGTWSNVKTVTNVWVVGKPYSRSGGEMYFITNKDYERLGRSYNIDIFDWNDIDFNRFTFNSLDGPVVVPMRKKAKKIQTFQLKVENARPNEPFGLLAIQINFKVGGLVKK